MLASIRRSTAVLLAAVALATLAAGCRRSDDPSPAAVVVSTKNAAAGVVAPNGVDILFAKMMVVHHAQAVTMSRTLLGKPGVPERVANIARFIAADQQREIDQMNDWLVAWKKPRVDPADPATRQLHGDGAGHGMMSDAQLAEAAKAPPAEATTLYLRQMIEHHKGAITMARSVLDVGTNAFIHGLAKHVINEQSAENDAMSALLAGPA